jgi:hypothetical protein
MVVILEKTGAFLQSGGDHACLTGAGLDLSRSSRDGRLARRRRGHGPTLWSWSTGPRWTDLRGTPPFRSGPSVPIGWPRSHASDGRRGDNGARRRLAGDFAGDGVLELGTTVWGAAGPYAELGERRTQPGLQGGVSGGHGGSHREGAARPTLACRSSATAQCVRNPRRGRGFSPHKQASGEDDGVHEATQREIDAAVGG